VLTPQAEPSDAYTVYFFKRGGALAQSSDATIDYFSGSCA
jgi:hypothetical protein